MENKDLLQIRTKPVGEFWDERFALIVLPTQGDGIAVLRETALEYAASSLFQERDMLIRCRFEGSTAPLHCVETLEVDVAYLDEALQMVSLLPLEEGMLAASDLIDGESYFVVKRVNGAERRIVLSNPRTTGQSILIDFADKADAFLSSPTLGFASRPFHRLQREFRKLFAWVRKRPSPKILEIDASSKILFEVNGIPMSTGSVWVHLQSKTKDCRPFRWTVPAEYAQQVFDPNFTCPVNKNRDEFVRELVDEFGTVIVEAYLKESRNFAGAKRTPFVWVIAAIDQIQNCGKAVVIVGDVLPFRPEQYAAD